jgi:putative ABC transport system permease protein
VALSGRVLLFALVTSIGAGVLSGVRPAWQLANSPLTSMKSDSMVGTTTEAGRLGWLLVSFEVGLRTLCLVAGGLLLHSFVVVLGVDRGFSEERAVSVQLSVTHARYQEAATRVAFMDRLLERVRSLRGVQSAGSASRLPLSGQERETRECLPGAKTIGWASLSVSQTGVATNAARTCAPHIFEGRAISQSAQPPG